MNDANVIKPGASNAVAFLRVLSCFFVVLIHAASGDTVGAHFLSAVATFSVPAFVIISGYLLLQTDKPIRSYLRKSAKLFLLSLVTAAVYFAYYRKSGQIESTDFGGFVRYLFTEPVHLWYLYAAIALYLVTPALSVFAKNAGKAVYRYALAVGFFFGSVAVMLVRSGIAPTVTAVLERSKAPYAIGFLFLYLFGGYVRRFGLNKPERVALTALGVLLTGGASVLICLGVRADLWLSFFSPNAMLGGMASFAVALSLFSDDRKKRRGLHFLSSLTLGIYLFHLLILEHISLYMPGTDAVSCILKAALSFAVCGAFVAAFVFLRRIITSRLKRQTKEYLK